MKLSIFNNEIKISEKYLLLYNAMSNQFLILNSHLQKIWEEISRSEKMENIPSKFFEQLTDNGFFVNDDLNESLHLRQTIEDMDNDRSNYTIIVNPTLDCNFKCWYCYESHFESQMSDETLKKIYKHIEHNLINTEGLKSFSLCFFGGEPLMYYSSIVLPLLKQGKEMCEKHEKKFYASFTTNGYLLDEKRIKEIAGISHVGMQITLDGNQENHDKTRFTKSGKGSYSKIIQNIKLLLENNCSVTLRINFTEANLEKTPEIIEDLKDISSENRKRLQIDFHQVWQDKKSRVGMEDQVTRVINNFRDEKLIVTHLNSHRFYNSCYADKVHGAVINYNGDIYRCTARDFKNFKRDGFLNEGGCIIWENAMNIKRQHAKMHNEHCHTCRIAPLCGGGCSQFALENFDKKICVNNFDDKQKDAHILSHFQNYFMNIRQ